MPAKASSRAGGVANDSAARIALGDFYGRGKIDFATIAYSVAKYYVAKDAKIVVYKNEMGC